MNFDLGHPSIVVTSLKTSSSALSSDHAPTEQECAQDQRAAPNPSHVPVAVGSSPCSSYACMPQGTPDTDPRFRPCEQADTSIRTPFLSSNYLPGESMWA